MTRVPERARIGRALLALCGHRAEKAQGLSDADWQLLDVLAEDHRLQPFLHGRHERGEIAGVPDSVAHRWREATRANAVTMLSQRRALLRAVETLGAEGIGCVALKGAALAWTVWPSPVERQMRDIDLLVAQDNAAEAYSALRAAGWQAPDLDAAELSRFAKAETHLPPLHSPEGVMCELHAHVWSRPPLPGSPMPVSDNAHFLGHARHSERLGAAIPCAEDMLAHLVVHAACSHLLNVGPMALVDVDLWCARKVIDWPAFWERAQREGFDRPAALVFALVDRWRRPDFLTECQSPHSIPPELLEEAELLLVQDLDLRKDVSVIASLAAGRIGGRLDQHPLDRAEGEATLGERIGQVATRIVSLATARLQKWMEG